MADIFISYARESEPQARRVVSELVRAGYDVWWDQDLLPHTTFGEVTEDHLRTAKAVLVLWSEIGVRSQWVRAEADVGRAARTLVQARLDGAEPPLPFNQVQATSLADWTGDPQHPGWRKVLASVAQLTGKASGPTPSPASPRPADSEVEGGVLLAVLPFDNLSADQEMLYFSDGVSEEILQTVAQTTNLRVIGRSSSFQFRGAEKDLRRVAAELNATHVLDGSVRRSGPKVRIAAHLIDCATQTTRWSGRFDRELSDIFQVQDDIAAAVAQALKATFAPSAHTGSIDPAAYELYLRARTQSPGREGRFNVGLLREAVSRAPTFAQAWAVLAYSLANQARYAADPEMSALHAEARQSAERALALDPAAGLAHAAIGYLYAPCGEYAAWEASLDKALAAAPRDPVVIYQASLASGWVGRTQDAVDLIDQVAVLDPLYAQGISWRALMLDYTGHEAEARAAYTEALERWPEFEFLFANASSFAARQGDWAWVDRMAEDMRRLGIETPIVRRVASMGQLLRHPGDASRAKAARGLEEDLAASGSLAPSSMVLAAELGALEEVYGAIERASFEHFFRPGAHLPNREIGMHALFSRRAAHLRVDPRFVGLCARLGLADHWLSTGRWPDFAAEVAYDLKAECARLTRRSAADSAV